MSPQPVPIFVADPRDAVGADFVVPELLGHDDRRANRYIVSGVQLTAERPGLDEPATLLELPRFCGHLTSR